MNRTHFLWCPCQQSHTDSEAIFHPALDLPRADFAAVQVGTAAQAAEGRLRRRNSHDVVILAPVRHNRLPLQAVTPADVSVIILERPVIVRIFAHPRFFRPSRSEFATTVSELIAIAPAASTGCRSRTSGGSAVTVCRAPAAIGIRQML